MNKRLLRQVGLFVALLVAQPFIWGMVRTSAESLHDRRTQEEQLSNVEDRFAIISSHVEANESSLEQLGLIFPSSDAVPQLLERFEQLGAQNGVVVEIRNINEAVPVSSKAQKTLVPFNVTLSAEGTIDGVLRYLSALENTPELVNVEQWSLTSSIDRNTGVTTYLINAVATFYLQQDGQAATE